VAIAPFEKTHGSRSSSMSYALSWKQQNLRYVLWAALLVIALAAMLLSLLYNQAGKNISVVIDGKAQTVETRKLMLSQLLDENQIKVAPQDKVSMPMNGALQDGDKVYINHAVAVNITADGGTKKIYTTSKTVGNTLEQAGLTLSGQDQLTPAMESSVHDNMDIKIVRTKSFVAKKVVKIPYQTVKKTDASMVEGKTKLVQSGQTGITFKNAKQPKEVLQKVPMDRLLLETDSPFLTPHPYRGKRNESGYVTLVAEAAAALKGVSLEEISTITTKNALERFGIR